MWLPRNSLVPALATSFVLAATAAAEVPDNTPPDGVNVWCGKAYESHVAAFDDLVERGWTHIPTTGDEPKLDFSCRPRLKPYVQGLDENGSIIIEANIDYTYGTPLTELDIPPGRPPTHGYVTITTPDANLAYDIPIPLRNTPTELSFPLRLLRPQTTAHTLTCTFTLTPSTPPLLTSNHPLHHLPPAPHNTTLVQTDLATHTLLLTPHTTLPHTLPTTFFPLAAYITWDSYLRDNFTHLHALKSAGINILHPVPGGTSLTHTWGGPTHLRAFLDAALAAGLWVQFDLRHIYRSPADVREHVRAARHHPALLLYYTADEPDGHNDALGAAAAAAAELAALDAFRPVSLVLNCENYFFAEYAAGADVVMVDVYSLGGVDVRWSARWGTECNRTYGCCGCDNCEAGVGELGRRVESVRALARVVGRRGVVVWGVGQGFGGAEYWPRVPERAEVVGQAKEAVRRGARGLAWWLWPVEEGVEEGIREVARWVEEQGLFGVRLREEEGGRTHDEL